MHPFQGHKQHRVERSRVAKLTKGYASGGAVHKDEKEDRKLFGKMLKEHHMEPTGKKAKHRADRPGRAHGGRMKGKGTSVNINILGGGDKGSPMPPPMMAPPGPPPGPVAGLGGPPPPPGAGPGGPPMMPPRAKGGRISSDGHTAKEPSERALKGRASGGSVKSGPAWKEGIRAGTHISHIPAKEPDIKNMNRPRPITYAKGGKVEHREVKFKAAGGMVSFRARGGRMEAPEGVASATKNTGGAGGGVGRLNKMSKYGGKPLREVDGAR